MVVIMRQKKSVKETKGPLLDENGGALIYNIDKASVLNKAINLVYTVEDLTVMVKTETMLVNMVVILMTVNIFMIKGHMHGHHHGHLAPWESKT